MIHAIRIEFSVLHAIACDKNVYAYDRTDAPPIAQKCTHMPTRMSYEQYVAIRRGACVIRYARNSLCGTSGEMRRRCVFVCVSPSIHRMFDQFTRMCDSAFGHMLFACYEMAGGEGGGG